MIGIPVQKAKVVYVSPSKFRELKKRAEKGWKRTHAKPTTHTASPQRAKVVSSIKKLTIIKGGKRAGTIKVSQGMYEKLKQAGLVRGNLYFLPERQYKITIRHGIGETQHTYVSEEAMKKLEKSGALKQLLSKSKPKTELYGEKPREELYEIKIGDKRIITSKGTVERMFTKEGKLKPEFAKEFQRSAETERRYQRIREIQEIPPKHRTLLEHGTLWYLQEKQKLREKQWKVEDKLEKEKAPIWKAMLVYPPYAVKKTEEKIGGWLKKKGVTKKVEWVSKKVQEGVGWLQVQHLRGIAKETKLAKKHPTLKLIGFREWTPKQAVKVQRGYEFGKGLVAGTIESPVKQPIKAGVSFGIGLATGGVGMPLGKMAFFKTTLGLSKFLPRGLVRGLYAGGKIAVPTAFGVAYASSLIARAEQLRGYPKEQGRMLGGAITTELIPSMVGYYVGMRYSPLSFRAHAEEQVFRAGLYGTKRELAIAKAQRDIVLSMRKAKLKQKVPLYEAWKGRFGRRTGKITEFLSRRGRGVFGSAEMKAFISDQQKYAYYPYSSYIRYKFYVGKSNLRLRRPFSYKNYYFPLLDKRTTLSYLYYLNKNSLKYNFLYSIKEKLYKVSTWFEPSTIKYYVRKGKLIRITGKPRIIKDIDALAGKFKSTARIKRFLKRLGIKSDVKTYPLIRLHPFHKGFQKVWLYELGKGKYTKGLKPIELLARKFEGTWSIREGKFYRFEKDLQDFIRFAQEPNWYKGIIKKKIVKPSKSKIEFLQVGWRKVPTETIWLFKPKPLAVVEKYPSVVSVSSFFSIPPIITVKPRKKPYARTRVKSVSVSKLSMPSLSSVKSLSSISSTTSLSSFFSSVSRSISRSMSRSPYSKSPYSYPSYSPSYPSYSPSRSSYPSSSLTSLSKSSVPPPTMPFKIPIPFGLKLKRSGKFKKVKYKRSYAPSLAGLTFGIKTKIPKPFIGTGIGIRPIPVR